MIYVHMAMWQCAWLTENYSVVNDSAKKNSVSYMQWLESILGLQICTQLSKVVIIVRHMEQHARTMPI